MMVAAIRSARGKRLMDREPQSVGTVCREVYSIVSMLEIV